MDHSKLEHRTDK